MYLGYIRVSRDKQTTALQEDAIQKVECKRVFIDTMSGVRDDRPEFLRMLDTARPGDVIVVWRLDRLGRSLRHLIETVTQMSERGIEFRSIKEQIDTTTPTGKLLFHIVGAMAEFERDIIRERTLAGLEAARARGRKGGRPQDDRNHEATQPSTGEGLVCGPREEYCGDHGANRLQESGHIL